MKTKLFIALSMCVLAFAACSKDDNDDTPGNGNSTEDYQPLSKGSTWHYTSTSGGDYTETVTGGDTTISTSNGVKKFYAIDNSAEGLRYVNKDNGVYISYGRFAQADTTFPLEYLRDAAVNTTWQQSGSYSGITATVDFKIVSRDGEKTVRGTTYKNVIGVTYTLGATIPILGTVPVATGEDFYAKGTGLIQRIIKDADPNSTNLSDSTFLVSAQIK